MQQMLYTKLLTHAKRALTTRRLTLLPTASLLIMLTLPFNASAQLPSFVALQTCVIAAQQVSHSALLDCYERYTMAASIQRATSFLGDFYAGLMSSPGETPSDTTINQQQSSRIRRPQEQTAPTANLPSATQTTPPKSPEKSTTPGIYY